MSSTLLCALIFLACALTFSGAQSEYNWFPFFNILWFHLFSWNASGFFCLYSFIFTLLNNYLPAGEPMCTLCICHYCRNQFLAGLHSLCPQAGAQVSSYRCTLCLWHLSFFSCYWQRAAEDDAVASTTGVTDASATIAACLMESAATTMNLSAPQVRPFPCLDLQHPAELRFLLTITEPLHIITSNNQPCSLTVFVCLLWCLCATENSCKGRCGENFKRGRLCSCDSDCATYDQCCPDYKNHCDARGRSFLARSTPVCMWGILNAC